nr:MAG TPA: hypothetical protein [Caudoviricetes sp.]
MIQNIYDKLLKLFVNKDIDYEIKYDDRGDKYVILESAEEKYLLFYYIIDNYSASYANIYINEDNQPAGKIKTSLAFYPLNLYLLMRLFYETKN